MKRALHLIEDSLSLRALAKQSLLMRSPRLLRQAQNPRDDRYSRGFTMPELLLTMGIFAILAGLITSSLLGGQRTASRSTTVDLFIADVKEQQIKAMVGDTQGSGLLSNYGIRVGTTNYTLFRDTYGTANFIVTLPDTISASTTFPSSEIVFQKGSGEIAGFTNGSNTVTFTDTTNSESQTVTLNRYGVVRGMN